MARILDQDPLLREQRATAAGTDEASVTTYLHPSERLLWMGRPDPRLDPEGWMFGCIGLGLVPFGGLMALLVLWKPLAGTIPFGGFWLLLVLFSVVPLSMLGIGLYMLTRPLRSRARARRSVHALTDRRLLTLVRWDRQDELRSIDIDQLGPITLAVGSDGRGTIAFETHSTRDSNAYRMTQSRAWLGIANAQVVHDQITALRAMRDRG